MIAMLQESKSIVFEALTCWPMRMPTLSASRLPRGRLHVPWQMSLPDDAGFWFIICFFKSCFHHLFFNMLLSCLWVFIMFLSTTFRFYSCLFRFIQVSVCPGRYSYRFSMVFMWYLLLPPVHHSPISKLFKHISCLFLFLPWWFDGATVPCFWKWKPYPVFGSGIGQWSGLPAGFLVQTVQTKKQFLHFVWFLVFFSFL